MHLGPNASRARGAWPKEASAGTPPAMSAPKPIFKLPRPEEAEREGVREHKKQTKEVEFLEHGLHEVQRAAQMVYAENMDLRTRIELLTVLASKLAGKSGLPEDVRSELAEFLKYTLPPRGALDPAGPGKENESMQKNAGSSAPMGGAAFAARLKELCKAMDRYECDEEDEMAGETRGTAKKRQSFGGKQNGGRPPRGDEEQQEVLAITENGEGLWCRTKNVCTELMDGWFS